LCQHSLGYLESVEVIKASCWRSKQGGMMPTRPGLRYAGCLTRCNSFHKHSDSAGELVKHLEELANAVKEAVELETAAGEATITASAATAASETSRKRSRSAAEAVDYLGNRRNAITQALSSEAQEHQQPEASGQNDEELDQHTANPVEGFPPQVCEVWH
jgi:hypothetical protein